MRSIVYTLLLAGIIPLSCVPYGLEDFKLMKTQTLRMNIKEWHLRQEPKDFGYTNSTDVCRIVATNIFAGSNNITAIISLESSSFQGRGRLFGTVAGDVYWFDGKTATLMNRRNP